MFVARLFFFLSLALLSAQSVTAQDAQPEAKPATPVEPQITFNLVHVDGPYIAMTFDDGPSEKLTPRLLDLLAAHHIKAT